MSILTAAGIPGIILALGAIGLYLLLPGRPGRIRGLAPLLLAIAAGTLLGTLLPPTAEGPRRGWFAAFSLLALIGAARMITHPRPVYSALYFILVVVSVTGLLVLQDAEFLAAALLIIYAGAILVTYLFVLMLAPQGNPAAYDRQTREPLAGCALGFALLAALTAGWQQLPQPGPGPAEAGFGSPLQLGSHQFTGYLLAVEIAGVLLLAALVGAVAIARRRENQEEIR
jgi:NADH-quinone oxidoreductase subunit J